VLSVKILKLYITKLRGIVDLELDFNGQNAVIVGPNGVGKSAVVDAIDFLLTGDITRLTGEATGGVSVAKHGPHIGYPPTDAKVTAEMQSVSGKTFTVSRTVAEKDNVHIAEAYKDEFKAIVEYTKSGAHFLSRRELLRYILATPGKRSEQIQSLLDIADLKNTRAAFVKLKTKAKNDFQSAKTTNTSNENALYRTLGISNEHQMLESINTFRSILGGEALADLSNGDFVADLTYSDSQNNNTITTLIHGIEELAGYLPEYISQLASCNTKIQDILEKVKSEEGSARDISTVKLIKVGLALLTGSGQCPLCLSQWISEDELKNFLLERKRKSETVSKLIDGFNCELASLEAIFSSYKAKIGTLPSSLEKYNKPFAELLSAELQNVSKFQSISASSIDSYDETNKEVVSYISGHSTEKMIKQLKTILETLKPLVDEQSKVRGAAWASLNQAKNYYTQICYFRHNMTKYELLVIKAEFLLNEYDATQEKLLNELYSSISERFTEFYKIMHKDDEGEFTATIENARAGVNMNVDFHGKGLYPPVAFHSEGHQDSMGIALFFALMEKLTTSDFGLVVLDDVVMSVDIEHRKNFCNILQTFFTDKQFIITTHDEVWAKYLKSENVVPNNNYILFSSWSVDTGPSVSFGHDTWKLSREKAENNINEASAFLRREMECYFENVCDKLKANLPYNSAHKWDFGEYMNSSYSRLKDVLKWAKKHANSVSNQELVEKLTQIETTVVDKLNKLNSENWVTNVLIHYNPQYSISKAEFLSAVDKMEEFCSCFECSKCKATLTIVFEGKTPSVLKCTCGNHLYLLKK